jgi:hypothetical protein
LPRQPAVAGDSTDARAWRQSHRTKLRELAHVPDLSVHASKVENESHAEIHATFWKLQMDHAWTVPAVELVKGQPQQTAILLADGGRKSSGADARRLLEAGYRVIALDLVGIGESAVAGREELAALLLAGVGGKWEEVGQVVEQELVDKGTAATVYDLE